MLKLEYREICEKDNAVMADIIRGNLRAYGLDIPGTVYFDTSLDNLSEYYRGDDRSYLVFIKDGQVAGGAGFAPFSGFEDCVELQKLYLDDSVKGRGLSYDMMKKAEISAAELGYKQIYLETHDNLKAAIHLYEKCGYKEIERPEAVVHSTMNRFFLKRL